MATIVKQSIFAVMRSSGAKTPELSDVLWGCPMTHTPIATLRLEVAWSHSPNPPGSRYPHGSKTIAVLALTVVALLAAAGTSVATTYISGVLMQRIQHLQHDFYEPRAQYSDVWKWQSRR
jgi:hypothetical protein